MSTLRYPLFILPLMLAACAQQEPPAVPVSDTTLYQCAHYNVSVDNDLKSAVATSRCSSQVMTPVRTRLGSKFTAKRINGRKTTKIAFSMKGDDIKLQVGKKSYPCVKAPPPKELAPYVEWPTRKNYPSGSIMGSVH